MIALAPARFVGLGAVPLQDVDSAILELDFIIKKLNFSGVEIASHVNGVSIGDGGGALGVLLPRLVHAWSVIPKAKESLTESPATTAKRFYYDALVFDPLAVRFVIDSFGASQVCVGSDYPFNMGDTDPLGTLQKAGIDAATLAAIASGNARRFLGV